MSKLAIVLLEGWVSNASVVVVYVLNDACLTPGQTGDYFPSGYTLISPTWPP